MRGARLCILSYLPECCAPRLWRHLLPPPEEEEMETATASEDLRMHQILSLPELEAMTALKARWRRALSPLPPAPTERQVHNIR